jgi:heme-degrading monooxygenase HmoA
MQIAMYSHHPELTLEMFDQIDRQIHAALGGGEPKGMIHHSVIGAGQGVTVYEIWESEEDFQAFGQLLLPIIAEMGLGPGHPVISPVYRLVQDARS